MSRVRFYLPVLLVLAALVGCRSAHTTSAILYIDEQNYDKAVQVIHEGFEFQDDEPDAFYYLAEAYSHIAEDAVEADEYDEAKKNYELAYEAYARSKELDPENFTEQVDTSLKYNYNNRLRQAKLDWEQGYYEQAEGHMRLAYSALPDSVTPVKSIARMKMQMSRDDEFIEKKDELLTEALVLLDQVLEGNPEAYELQLDKASVLAALERNDEARRIYDELLAAHGDDTVLLLEIASLAQDDGDFARAADFYVKVVDLNEADTDASNDSQNKDMLVAAGTWYSQRSVGRYEEAITVLDRAANYELDPRENTMLTRVMTFYNYGKKLKDESLTESDPVAKADMEATAKVQFDRAVEVGVAMTNLYVANSQGFMYLSLAQLELGDFAASDANFKTFQELSGGSTQ